MPIYAGTDAGGVIAHGRIADEIEALKAVGLSPTDALGAACWDARAWLGRPALEHGASADLLCFAEDPRTGADVVNNPALVILRGRIFSNACGLLARGALLPAVPNPESLRSCPPCRTPEVAALSARCARTPESLRSCPPCRTPESLRSCPPCRTPESLRSCPPAEPPSRSLLPAVPNPRVAALLPAVRSRACPTIAPTSTSTSASPTAAG